MPRLAAWVCREAAQTKSLPSCWATRSHGSCKDRVVSVAPGVLFLFRHSRREPPDQFFSLYPVRKIHATAIMQSSRNSSVMPKLTPTLTSEVP
jgi:hypothetical protein